jgi:putative endonuclease
MSRIKNTERGRAGEALAEAYLEEQGLQVLARNFRFKRAEIDRIATDQKELIIVEVKIRQNNLFGYPEESITKQKQRLMTEAGYAYKEEYKIMLPVRFDIIAISIDEKEIMHYRDVF